ncbi:HupE/UreJ family protein [Sinorhizobium numidicum]|uniref:HupE/UreJ family protein n=1 Tax=Sinorhizobium numidicum TaxID=680248 RepID=A0ABY8CRL1_9HYPH|nr:HupE/UreJ family protein [Sinorhizobium numidicum]WEX73808.1 HupE/UreJ family protein [Sinorhizobium numidicum]WEX79793.1 HupE/UreJ family protein [Sinorhizobium numidicum]
MNLRNLTTLAAVVATVPGQALAHTGGDHVHGAASGFLHPFSGLDHLVAMVAVGLIAARLGGPALWRLPLAFVSAMVFGAVMAKTGMNMPLTETAILASVIAFGATLIVNANVPVTLVVAGTAAFAFFHGFAHGVEGSAAAPFGYVLGFVCGTAILHAIGIAARWALLRYSGVATAALRIVGTLVTGVGIGLAYLA